jgi:hypothetical protein
LRVASRITVDAARIGLFDPLNVPSAPIRPTTAPRLPQGLGRIYLCILLFILLSFFTAPHAPNLSTQHLYARAPAHLRTRSRTPARPRTLSVWCGDFWGAPQNTLRGRILPSPNEVFSSGARSGADSVKGRQERQRCLLERQSNVHSPELTPADGDGFCRPGRAAAC